MATKPRVQPAARKPVETRRAIGVRAKVVLIPMLTVLAAITGASSAFAANAALTVTAPAISVIEQSPVNGVVATFTDPAADAASNYSATIAWGDGVTTPGTVTGGSGSYSVSASHTYNDEMTVNATVTVTSVTGSTATATALATIGEGDNGSLAGRTLTLGVNSAYSGPVASFTDVLLNQVAADWLATITWGDGAVGPAVITGGNGNFVINGSHTYATVGSFPISVSLSEDAPSAINNISIAGQAIVKVAFTMSANTISVPEGTAFNGQIAQFVDNLATDPATAYTAAVNWGDGVTTSGAVTSDGVGGFFVNANHTYEGEGNFTTTVSIADSDGSSTSAGAMATASEADAFAGAGTTLTLPPAVAYNGAVATFTDTYLGQTTADLTATINWGDGTTTAATITGGNGTFTANGSHAYAALGTYSVVTSLTEVTPAPTATATTAVRVVQPVTITGNAISAVEGRSFSGLVATFSDNLGNDPLSNYSATINWGDGTSTAGAIAADATGNFTISGGHMYSDEGTFAVSVSMSDTDGYGGSTAGSAAVADSDIFAGSGITTTVPMNHASSLAVATFTDSNAAQTPSDLVATINWGDGTSGTGVVTGGSGSFTVTGTHSYAVIGTYTTSIGLSEDTGAGLTTATGSVTVVVPFVATATAVSVAERSAFSGPVATFTDNLGADALTNYSATINWGDGTSTSGTIVASGGNNFTVNGMHTYGDEGSFPTTVAISDSDGSSATAAGAAAATEIDNFTGTANSFTSLYGVAFSGATATFTDAAPTALADLSASIAWGDGTTSTATLTGDGTTFVASGTHSYAAAGSYAVVTTLRDASLNAASAAVTGTATITTPIVDTFSPDMGFARAVAGQPFSGAIGHFTDTNHAAPAAALLATINWGDGTTASAGTVSRDASGSLTVSGSHTYALHGAYFVKVTIATPSGSAHATATTLMLVAKHAKHDGDDAKDEHGTDNAKPSPTSAASPLNAGARRVN